MSACSRCQRPATTEAMAKPATSPRNGLRKLPTQARSRARVEAILKAAGSLLGEVGYDGVTTNLKAERARMLAAWSDITGAMIASLDRSKPGERGKLLEELKTILSAYLDAKLTAVG